MENATSLIIREATNKDIKSITKIYNHAILHTIVTFETEPRTIQFQEDWLTNRSWKHPVLVYFLIKGDDDLEIISNHGVVQ